MQLKTTPEDFIVVELAEHTMTPDGAYILIELTKRNMTTERAIDQLANYLGAQRKAFGYAGTKDARALTKQCVSIRGDVAARLLQFRADAVHVRVLGRIGEPLGLGMLQGNRFEIVVRNIADEQPTPLDRIPNYFDEQRFSRANARLGLLILRGEWHAAVDLVLSTDDEFGPKIQAHLDARSGDWNGALRMLPKHTLLMYVHAYQSLLFNEILRRYIREHDSAAIDIDGPVALTVPTVVVPQMTIPLFGFSTERHPLFGVWYEELLAADGLDARSFVVRSMPFLTVEGGERDAFFDITHLDISPLEADDIFAGKKKQRLSFSLPKGCYATMAAKCMYRVGSVLGGQ